MGSLFFLFLLADMPSICRVLGQLARGTPTTTYGMHALHTSAQLAVDTIPAREFNETMCVRSVLYFTFLAGNQTHFRVTTATSFDVGDISYRITLLFVTRGSHLWKNIKYQISNNMVPPSSSFSKNPDDQPMVINFTGPNK